MKNKIAIYVCGSGGSGKTTFVKENFKEYVQINVDNSYEELLLSNGLGLKIHDFTENQKKTALEYFEKSKEIVNKLFFESIKREDNIVIDTVGRDFDYILNQRKYLHSQGYNSFMVMLFASLETCHERVTNRERSYDFDLTRDSWVLSYKNLVDFALEFGDHFLFIDTETPNFITERLNNFKNTLKIHKKLI